MGKINLRRYVERRKKAWHENMKIEPAPFFGDICHAEGIVRSDPALLVSTQVPIVRKELEADLYGAAGAPRIFQGTARVIMSTDTISELQPGEILVAPGTSAVWIVAFGMSCISGTVEGTH